MARPLSLFLLCLLLLTATGVAGAQQGAKNPELIDEQTAPANPQPAAPPVETAPPDPPAGAGNAGAQEKKLVEVAGPVVPASGPLAGQTIYRKSFALLIGVNDYPNLPANLSLRYAVKDATDLRDVLVRSYGFPAGNVTTLTNEQATKRNIEDALDDLTDNAKVGPEDRVLVFFSGHGQTVATAVGGDMGFLIPEDAKVDLSAPGNIGPYNRSCLSMSAIRSMLESCPAKHVLLLADACYSGLLAHSKGTEALRLDVVATMAQLRARQVVTAGMKDEESTELPEYGHGAFTYKLLEQLRARAATAGAVFTATDLYDSLRTSVTNLTNGKQLPQIGSFDTEGDFLFITTAAPAVGDAASRWQIGMSLYDREKYAEAELYLREAVKAEPRNAKYQYGLGISLTGQGKDAEAMTCYREVVRIEPSSAMGQDASGSILAFEKKYAEAEPYFREAVRIEPANVLFQSDLGCILFMEQKYAEAVPFFHETIKAAPANAGFQNNLGNTLVSLKRYAEAEPYLREAVRIEPTNAQFQNSLGTDLFDQANYAGAESCFREAARIEPTNAQYQSNLDSTLRQLKK